MSVRNFLLCVIVWIAYYDGKWPNGYILRGEIPWNNVGV